MSAAVSLRAGGGEELAQGDPAISSKAAVGRVEGGQAADLPGTGNQPFPANLHLGVAEWSAPGECPHDLAVQAIDFSILDARNRSPDQRSARRPVDPGDLPARSAFPAEQRRGFLGERSGRGRSLRFAAPAASLDPGHHVAQRRARRTVRQRLERGSFLRLALAQESALVRPSSA